jgi:hypothetical protein
VVVTFLIGCAVLLIVGCAATRSESPKQQGDTEATRGQTRPAKAASEVARCDGTRTIRRYSRSVVTNEVPGCPNGGLLLGTDKPDELAGQVGDDEVRGLGGRDRLDGGPGNDILYGGDGDDTVEPPGLPSRGTDVIYGGDGSDLIDARGYGRQPDKLYCGEDKDQYLADNNDQVGSSCEKRLPSYGGVG